MIRVEQVKLPIGYTADTVLRAVARILGVPPHEMISVSVLRRSLDARHKPDITFVASVAASVKGEKRFYKRYKVYTPSKTSLKEWALPHCDRRVVIVGSGPAGMFAALAFAEAGAKPIVIERGYDVDKRVAAVQAFREGGPLDPDCNVQFGEGGAGTFSDGKLNTGTQSPLISTVLGELVSLGAPKVITYEAKPHVGTDNLVKVVRAARERVQALGGTYLFGTCVSDLVVRGGRVVGVEVEGAHHGVIEAECVLLGIGHSARDTYRMLRQRGVAMEQKPFSVGVRVEHTQASINKAQFALEHAPFAADYKLSTHLDNGKGVYTFCMCPGGTVVNAASIPGTVVTNGMSEFARAERNANAAVLVGVDGSDFGQGLFDGMFFQERIERAAYDMTHSYLAPCQTYGDFCRGRVTDRFGSVTPTIEPGHACVDLNALFPAFVTDALKQGIAAFGTRLKGYDAPDAVLTAPETRSSAPVRILRNDDGEASLAGLYPIGEGAGYAGGITSAAVDGLRAAMRIIGVRV